MFSIARVEALDQIEAAAHLFDDAVDRSAAQRFLAEPGHHLLVALDDAGATVGFVSGVETTHPDKGTEMFLYELAVDDAHQRRGIGTALVAALADLARDAGCYGMWVLTDRDNIPAMAAYRRAGAEEPSDHAMLAWSFAP